MTALIGHSLGLLCAVLCVLLVIYADELADRADRRE